jgi:hypothetical protein
MSEEVSNVLAPGLQSSASYGFTMRLHMPQQGGAFARIARAIADAEAMLAIAEATSVRLGACKAVKTATALGFAQLQARRSVPARPLHLVIRSASEPCVGKTQLRCLATLLADLVRECGR